jgi:thiol-disulfide isomerase/thioredoxin
MRRALAIVLLLLALPAAGADVEVHLFWAIGCPHCERAIEFLDRVAADNPNVRLHKLEVTRSRENAALMIQTAERLGVEAGSVPLTVVGNRAWVGYDSEAGIGREIAAEIAACLESGCPSAVPAKREARMPEAVRLPLVGEVRTATLSLPALTVLLAAADGFNPCAMWVLVFLLGLLAGMKDRARMWLLGIAFVAASAAVYLLILGAWLNVLLLAGTLALVRIAIGVVALAGGGYYLKEFITNADMKCEITAPERRRRTLERLKALAQQRNLVPALAGIVLLALAVNVVEFLCSAGIPAVFAQVLALSELAPWEYLGYLGLYVGVFMLDDLVVLVAALKTLEVTGLTGRYARWSNAVGGVTLLVIGTLLILRPGWLAFA